MYDYLLFSEVASVIKQTDIIIIIIVFNILIIFQLFTTFLSLLHNITSYWCDLLWSDSEYHYRYSGYGLTFIKKRYAII